MEPQITQMGANTSTRNSRSYVRVHQQNGCGQFVSSEACQRIFPNLRPSAPSAVLIVFDEFVLSV
jgi:hypothetical protein